MLKKELRVRRYVWLTITCLLIAGTFFALDLQSVSTGDDLGYMFGDTTHHLGDGERIHTPADITRTLSLHYITTNGRFLVHWIAMFSLNIAGHTPFCIINSLIFLLTAVFFTRISGFTKQLSANTLLLGAIALWLSVPEPGVNWLGLVCYATNYLWPACASLAIILLINSRSEKGKGRGVLKIVAGTVFALIAGSLQESFSLPLSGGLLVLWIVRRKSYTTRQKILTLAYWLGTLVCVVAPGNLNHATQGGGFTADAILHKLNALYWAIWEQSPTIVPAICIAICLMVARFRAFGHFFKRNCLLVSTIIFALLLACVTFTSDRQLTLPGILCGIVIIQTVITFVTNRRKRVINAGKVMHSPWLTSLLIVIYTAGFVGAGTARETTSTHLRLLHSQASQGKSTLIYDITRLGEQTTGEQCETMRVKFEATCDRLFERFDFRHLPVVFDGYTMRGLSRLYSPGGNSKYITTILPTTPEKIADAAEGSYVAEEKIKTNFLMKGYRCFSIPVGIEVRQLRDSNGTAVPYERTRLASQILVVIPDTQETRNLTYSN